MQTPPPPSFSADGDKPINISSKSNVLDQTAKTPFQSGSSFYQRSFKSELHPNRTFITDTRNNTRFYPTTSLRPTGFYQPKTEGKPNDRKNGIISRLAQNFGAKQAQKLQQHQQQPSTHLQQPRNVPHVPRPIKLTHPQYYSNPAHLQQQQKQQPQPQQQQKPQLPPPITPHQHLPPPITPHQHLPPPITPHQHLPQPHPQTITRTHVQPLQDVRGANQQVGLPTATKAPLSGIQYTQPTPQHINKSQQFSRSRSEPIPVPNITVNGKTYSIMRKIGQGGSAEVYEGFEPKTSQTVAIKCIFLAKADQKTQENYFNEKALLSKLCDCKYVVRMFDCEYKADCKKLVIVMEKGDADLSQVIDPFCKSRIDGPKKDIFIKFYWLGMLLAVNDIHQRNIIHADLKPVNFILVKNEIKLIDFGIASVANPEDNSIIRDFRFGTPNYMAPESLRNRSADESFQHLNTHNGDENKQLERTVIKFNSKVDIWSLGCILYNLVYGRPPFDYLKDPHTKIQAIKDPKHVISFPKVNDPNLIDCMQRCLRYNPDDRPTVQELLEHNYLK